MDVMKLLRNKSTRNGTMEKNEDSLFPKLSKYTFLQSFPQGFLACYVATRTDITSVIPVQPSVAFQ